MSKKKAAKLTFVDHDDAAGIETNEDGVRTVRIKEFDLNKMHPTGPDDLEHGCRFIVIGRPGTGKSKILEHIMLYKNWICPVIQVFSGTESVNHFYKDKMTEITLFNELDMKAMEDFAKRQNIARQWLPNPWAMQILDDVADDPAMLKRKPFPAYYRKGRHWAMLHGEAYQYPMDIAPGQRTCVDYTFILANAIITEREKMYENFGSGAIPSFNDFCDLLDQLTEDHSALVIDNTSSSPRIEDRIFYFKANLDRVPRHFRIGCPEAYAFDEDRRNKNYVESIL